MLKLKHVKYRVKIIDETNLIRNTRLMSKILYVGVYKMITGRLLMKMSKLYLVNIEYLNLFNFVFNIKQLIYWFFPNLFLILCTLYALSRLQRIELNKLCMPLNQTCRENISLDSIIFYHCNGKPKYYMYVIPFKIFVLDGFLPNVFIVTLYEHKNTCKLKKVDDCMRDGCVFFLKKYERIENNKAVRRLSKHILITDPETKLNNYKIVIKNV